MADGTLEHVNLTVSDPDRTAALMSALFGWRVRWRGPARNGGYTVHVGTEDSYLAIYRYAEGQAPESLGEAEGRLNHIGVVVEDLDSAEVRVREAGYRPHSHGAYEPGRRFYFDDHDGIEFEVVSYA
ncbi:VOC family protein [Allosphingosinicella sp.]|uniref:VOC family protein n=1 Tax=Allosphingosinicella sp. TaxID=2823234 RepID=UPI002F139D3E